MWFCRLWLFLLHSVCCMIAPWISFMWTLPRCLPSSCKICWGAPWSSLSLGQQVAFLCISMSYAGSISAPVLIALSGPLSPHTVHCPMVSATKQPLETCLSSAQLWLKDCQGRWHSNFLACIFWITDGKFGIGGGGVRHVST